MYLSASCDVLIPPNCSIPGSLCAWASFISMRDAALDNAVEETAASATGGVAAALAESALLCHVEHAKRSILAWLPSSSDCNSR